MATIMPKEKRVQDALRWISEHREEKEIRDLIREASFHFNLTPKNEDYLYRLFLDKDTGKHESGSGPEQE